MELDDIYSEFEEENEQEYDFGYKEVVEERKKHKDALRQRLYKYYLKDDEIDKLFKIIENAENKMDKIKNNTDYKNAQAGDILRMSEKLKDIQNQMKEEFEKELNKTLKRKYENAKKIIESRKKKQ